jgi:predicted transposase YdaD
MKLFSATPHDAIFKQLLHHQAIARDFLQIHLPTTLLYTPKRSGHIT